MEPNGAAEVLPTGQRPSRLLVVVAAGVMLALVVSLGVLLLSGGGPRSVNPDDRPSVAVTDPEPVEETSDSPAVEGIEEGVEQQAPAFEDDPSSGEEVPRVDPAPPGEVTVAIPTSATVVEGAAIEAVIEGFEQTTGHRVSVIEVSESPGEFLAARSTADALPDVFWHAQIAPFVSFARGGQMQPLRADVAASLRTVPLPAGLADAVAVDGEVYSVPIGLTVKSLVWYPRTTFVNAGYAEPRTWGELLELSERMAADGFAPWCIGIESGPATGWVVTDWLEDLMLRLHDADVYDRWVVNEVSFDSPQFRSAVATMGDIWFREGWVWGGRSSIVETSFGDSIGQVAPPSPDCLLHRQAAFALSFLPDELEVGVDVDVFPLPGLDADAAPLIVTAYLPAIYTDNPRGFELLDYLTTADAHARWAAAATQTVAGRSDVVPDGAMPLQRRQAEFLAAAPVVRFDGSDQMPGRVGASAFWETMTEFVAGTASLDEAVERIDRAWP